MGPHYDAAIRQQAIIKAELERLSRHPSAPEDTGGQALTLIGIAAVLFCLPMVF